MSQPKVHPDPTARVRAAVAGANGYAGMTLVHLLARHPGVELVQLTSRSHVGQHYSTVFPLLGQEGEFLTEPDAGKVDVVFSCLPHNVGASRAEGWLEAGAHVIDMSADFRLKDPFQYPIWYQQEHPAPRLLPRAAFGIPELHAEEIQEADLIAVPGCYSTAAILALAPAVAGGFATSEIVVDAKSGFSGAGRSLSLGAHFAEVNESVRAYAIGGHRHLPELTQELGRLCPDHRLNVTFVPHLIPMTRGILVTCYLDLQGSLEALVEAYREFYAEQPFVTVVDSPPSTKLVSHTNHCAIHVGAQGPKAVVIAAIDNLVKGASGQGVQCFNLAFGRDRTEGLTVPLQWP